MRMRVQVVIESDSGEREVIEEVARLERAGLRPEEVGLTLAEAKSLLEGVQKTMVTHQVEEYVTHCRGCPDCGKPRPRKGQHEIVYRTLFGKLKLHR